MPAELALDAFDLNAEEVRGRFDWAVRQGHPQWLWPDTTFKAWQAALAQFEVVGKDILTDGVAREPLVGHAQDIGVAGYTCGMGPLLGFWHMMGQLSAPVAVAEVLEYQYRHNVIRMHRMARRAVVVVDGLADRGVQVTVLKGMHTGYAYFPSAGCRPLSDIDLLIDKADKALAAEVLLKMDFRPGRATKNPPEQNWRMARSPTVPRSLSFVHADDPWSVDLQTSLNRRYSYGAAVLELDVLKSPDGLVAWDLSPRASTLGPVALVVHLACHASCGHESLSLLRIFELVSVIRAHQQRPRFWDDIIDLADRARSLAMTYPVFKLAEQLAPGTVPVRVLNICECRAPDSVRRVIDRLSPHDAQRIIRCSLEERFMWTRSPLHRVMQIFREVWPPGTPFADQISLCRMRAWRLVRGTLTR